jgi:hypothetical protein
MPPWLADRMDGRALRIKRDRGKADLDFAA